MSANGEQFSNFPRSHLALFDQNQKIFSLLSSRTKKIIKFSQKQQINLKLASLPVDKSNYSPSLCSSCTKELIVQCYWSDGAVGSSASGTKTAAEKKRLVGLLHQRRKRKRVVPRTWSRSIPGQRKHCHSNLLNSLCRFISCCMLLGLCVWLYDLLMNRE